MIIVFEVHFTRLWVHLCFSYRLVFVFQQDNLAFPLICPDWNADEEMLLLEGIEMYGLANWNEVAEHVGTKNRSQCIEHYNKEYMNSTCFPLPDMSHVMGKNREELLAMAKEQSQTKKGATSGEVDLKEESPFSAGIKMEDQKKEGQAGRSSSSISLGIVSCAYGTELTVIIDIESSHTQCQMYFLLFFDNACHKLHSDLFSLSEVDTVAGSSIGKMSFGASKRTSGKAPSNDGLDATKVEEFQSDRSIGEKKPRTSGDEGVSMLELSGYNSKRHEFDIEYDNDAEQLLADMEFKDADTSAEREMKIRVLRIYSKRLDERKRRKDFILERNLLYPNSFEKDLTLEEKELCKQYKVFMRFLSKEEHEQLLRSVVEERRILKRIRDLQEARSAGCRTSAEAERYTKEKKNREGGKHLQSRMNNQKGEVEVGSLSPSNNYKSPSHGGGTESSDKWDVTELIGADLLSEAEKELCGEIRTLPAHYLNMVQAISMGILSGNISKKSDAHVLFNVDPTKVDKVYDMLIKKGIIAQT
ncbi:hypothetical protein ACS0TY_017975 [Phlomoides rotata]